MYRQSSEANAPSSMTLYDDKFNILNIPVTNYTGRLTILDFVPDPSSGGNRSFVVYGGQMSEDFTGTPCPDNSCFSISFVSANFNTPYGFDNSASEVYTGLVGMLNKFISLSQMPKIEILPLRGVTSTGTRLARAYSLGLCRLILGTRLLVIPQHPFSLRSRS